MPAPAVLHTKSFPRPRSPEGAHHHIFESGNCHTVLYGPRGCSERDGASGVVSPETSLPQPPPPFCSAVLRRPSVTASGGGCCLDWRGVAWGGGVAIKTAVRGCFGVYAPLWGCLGGGWYSWARSPPPPAGQKSTREGKKGLCGGV